MATGKQSIPPEIQALVNRARQLSRSIEQTGPANADSIPQALAIIQDARSQLAALSSSSFVSQSSIDQAFASLVESEARLVATEQVIAKAEPALPESAGQTVNDDAVNTPNKPPPLQAGPDGRVSVPPATTTPTNATQPDVGASSTGTDQPTKTFDKTQATYDGVSGQTMPASPTDAASDPNTNVGNQAPTTAGVGQVDDNIRPTPESQSVKVNNGFNDPQPIVPQPNILSKFASSTYNASVYLMTPTQYETLIKSKQKKVNGYNLLFQTGGAPTNVGGAKGALGTANTATQSDLEAEGIGLAANVATPGAKDPDAGRNPFFPDDFYIDSITLENMFPGKQTSAAHMATNIKFTVVEPGGITLLDRLYQAVQDQAPKNKAGAVNYTAAQYLMVIRWYGYDEAGNLIRPGAKGKDGLSDPNAICEKFIPFLIKKINWGVSNKLVSYEFEGAPVGQNVAGTTARGTVPFDIELSDSTVGGLLGGAAKYGTGATTTASPGASTTATTGSDGRTTNDPRRTDSATGGLNSVDGTALTSPANAAAAPTPKKTITAGLMGAMNELQAERVASGVYQYPDRYELVFANGAEAIRDALITLPGKIKNQRATPMAPAAAVDPTPLQWHQQRLLIPQAKTLLDNGPTTM